MPKGKTKRIGGTDLSAKCFLFTDGQPEPKFWLLPCFDPTSSEKTRVLIQRNLDHWDSIQKHIPLSEQKRLRWELEGCAQSVGIALREVILSDAEMNLMMAERFAARMLDLADLEKLYA